MSDRMISAGAVKAALTGWETEPTDEEIEYTIDNLPDIEPVEWEYYVNDEGKARWRCPVCGKRCNHNPAYKRFCSQCGMPIRLAK